MRMNHNDFITSNKQECICYTDSGHEDYVDDEGNFIILDQASERVYAKAINNRKSRQIKNNDIFPYKFYIKINPESIVYNPKKIHSVNEQNKLSFVDSACKSGWFFKEVPKSIFDKYLLFLKTQDTRWFKEVNKEIK